MTGIMGGTFNPIHYGHLRLAEHIREEFCLERILFVPAGTPPHKSGMKLIPARHRLAMTRLAIADNPAFLIAEHEIGKKGYSYTVDTLERLRAEGYDQLVLILGADSVAQLGSWHQPGGILSRAMIVAAPRPDTDPSVLQAVITELKGKYGGEFRISTAAAMPHSSTEIRGLVSKGQSIRYLVPEPVLHYIASHGFYGKDQT